MSRINHPLLIWSKSTGRKIGWLSDQVGISASALRLYLNGLSPAPKPVRMAFETLTEGAVKSSDWPEEKQ